MNDNVFFLIIVVWLSVTLGLPRTYAPFVSALAGAVLTFALNWTDATTSVERATEVIVAGLQWGMTAVGTHKIIATIGELRERWTDAS